MTVPASTTVQRPSWSVPVDSITYSYGASPQTIPGAVASIDMYHTGITVPATIASTVYGTVPGATAVSDSQWSIPCNSSFPLTLTFGGKPFNLNERDTIRKDSSSGICYGAIQAGPGAIYKVGAPFLRNVYTIFGAAMDGTNVTFNVGFADKVLRTTPAFTASASQPTITKPTGTGTLNPTIKPSSGSQNTLSSAAVLLSAFSAAIAMFF